MERKNEDERVYAIGSLSPRQNKVYNLKKPKKTKWVIPAVMIVLLIAAGLIAFLLLRDRSDVMKGTWVYDQYTKYEFDGKGNGCLHEESLDYEYTYSVKGDKLKMDFSDPSVRDCEYTITIDGDDLTLIGGEGTIGGTYHLKKQ